MSLRIQNNIAAMNAHRQLQISSNNMSKSMERLSSGFRINRAADDAAGLSISQAFRADIASYKVASRNTSEANSMLQVAEGAMDQIGNMLTRLKELATQAASANSGANLDKIDAEREKLVAEIERIAQGTEYAGSTLLDGSFGAVSEEWQSSGVGAGDVVLDADNGLSYTFAQVGGGTTLSFTFNDTPALTAQAYTMTTNGNASEIVMEGTNGEAFLGTFSGSTLTFGTIGLTIVGDSALTTGAGSIVSDTLTVADTGFTSMSVSSSATTGTWSIADDGSSVTLTNGSESQAVTLAGNGAQTLDFDQLGIKISLGSTYTGGDLNNLQFDVSNTGESTFQVGAKNDADKDRIDISIGNATTSALGIDDLDLGTISGAQDALDTIDAAIGTLNEARGAIGAYQNRLGYAAANLATTIENVQAAESVIRDVDMASEMTMFTKNQILMQAGTAMLAQANMAPQQVLSLF